MNSTEWEYPMTGTWTVSIMLSPRTRANYTIQIDEHANYAATRMLAHVSRTDEGLETTFNGESFLRSCSFPSLASAQEYCLSDSERWN